MNFVLEASGVTETVEKMRIAEEKEQDEERRKDFVDKDGRPMYFTKENVTEIYGEYEATKIDLINGIYKTMSKDQVKKHEILTDQSEKSNNFPARRIKLHRLLHHGRQAARYALRARITLQ